MSFVGTRPEAVKYVEKYKPEYFAMFDVLRKTEFEQILLKHFHKLPRVNDFQYYGECLNWLQKINIVTLQKEVMLYCMCAPLLSGS